MNQTNIPGSPTKEATGTSEKVLVGVTHQSQPDHSGPVHVIAPRAQQRAVIAPEADSGRSIYLLRFYDGALMRFNGTSWVVAAAAPDSSWADLFDAGHSIPCVLYPLGIDLYAAWHLPSVGEGSGITISGFFRDGEFVEVNRIEQAEEQMAWSNPMNYRGKIRWFAASSAELLPVFEADRNGKISRRDLSVEGAEWSPFSGMANDIANQLSFGGFLEPHNERLHFGTTNFSSNGECDSSGKILDRRMFCDPGMSLQSRAVPLRSKFASGEVSLEKPFSSDDYHHLARTMLSQVSFKGQMFYVGIDGKLYWQDDLRHTMVEIYDLSHEIEVFNPGVTYETTGTEPAGKEEAAWNEQQDFYQSVFPFDFLCRIDFKDGDFEGRAALNTGRTPCGSITDDDGCRLLTESGSVILADDAPYSHFIESEKVRNVTKSMPVDLEEEIDLPLVEEDCRAFYQIPEGTEVGVAYALAGCTENFNNVPNPATVSMFVFRDSLYAVIATGTKQRALNRPPTVLVKFAIDMDEESWLTDGPAVTGHTATALTENGTAVNANGMVTILDEKQCVLHLLYDDFETQQLKHLEIKLEYPRQFYRGVVMSTERIIPEGFLIDVRSPLTQGCAVDYHGDEPFIFITGMSLRADHKSVLVDYVAYSPSSTPITVNFRHAIGTQDRFFRGEKPGFIKTTPLVTDVAHDPTNIITATPGGVHHRFVHNLEVDGLDKFTGEIQYEAHPTYAS